MAGAPAWRSAATVESLHFTLGPGAAPTVAFSSPSITTGETKSSNPGEAYCDTELVDARTGRIDTFDYFRKTIEQAELEDIVVPIVSRSEVVARRWATPLALVFIDGGHTFEAACADYNIWAGHVMPGGYLLIHDIFFDPAEGGQAPRHIYERACRSGLFDDLGVLKTLAVLQRRTGRNSSADLPA